MSIRRPRGPKPTLKHLGFLEAMSALSEQSAEARALRAGFLTLRFFDEWRLLGATVAGASSPMLRTTRAAVDALHEDGDLQFLLTRLLDGMLMLRDADASAVLPRLNALADLYSQRRAPALASDVRQLVATSGAAASTDRISAPTEAAA